MSRARFITPVAEGRVLIFHFPFRGTRLVLGREREPRSEIDRL
jgi:hypothetical protein